MKSFKENISNWTDIDIAMYYLSVSLGMVDEHADFATEVKWVFWSNNPICALLYNMLMEMINIGFLETNDDDQVRYNQQFNLIKFGP